MCLSSISEKRRTRTPPWPDGEITNRTHFWRSTLIASITWPLPNEPIWRPNRTRAISQTPLLPAPNLGFSPRLPSGPKGRPSVSAGNGQTKITNRTQSHVPTPIVPIACRSSNEPNRPPKSNPRHLRPAPLGGVVVATRPSQPARLPRPAHFPDNLKEHPRSFR
jgi:hypothetical protein